MEEEAIREVLEGIVLFLCSRIAGRTPV